MLYLAARPGFRALLQAHLTTWWRVHLAQLDARAAIRIAMIDARVRIAQSNAEYRIWLAEDWARQAGAAQARPRYMVPS
jgi:hypothetical protein